uniref:Protein S100 n=1 Tax=Squalus acanthias TaxID=7797 RepID=Q8AYJ2_SQUAC|nr:S-100 calcium-binding protein A1 [Squalus acanthias]
MTELESAMAGIIGVFRKYSGKEGDKYSLSNNEMVDLLKAELPNFLKSQKDKAAVDKIMKDLDRNKDGELDFQEFVVLIAALAAACNDFFVDHLKSKGKM